MKPRMSSVQHYCPAPSDVGDVWRLGRQRGAAENAEFADHVVVDRAIIDGGCRSRSSTDRTPASHSLLVLEESSPDAVPQASMPCWEGPCCWVGSPSASLGSSGQIEARHVQWSPGPTMLAMRGRHGSCMSYL